MAEEHIPAWKKAGLKKASSTSSENYDPLEAGLKRNAGSAVADHSAKKPPKRQKVPKAERSIRAVATEPDQLAYLKQFSDDRANWKFSKQKQNWIIRHIYTITEHEEALINYIESIQGGSRNRILEEALDLVKKWNEFMAINPLNDENGTAVNSAETPDKAADKETEDKTEPKSESKTDTETNAEPKGILKNKSEHKVENNVPSEAAARRAQLIATRLSGEKPDLKYI